MKNLLPLLFLLMTGCSKENPDPVQQPPKTTYQVQHDDLNYRGLEYYRVIVNDTTVTQITNGAYWYELPVIETVTTGATIHVEFAYFQNEAFGNHTMTTTITAGNQSQSWPAAASGEYTYTAQ